jgi:hypothetical protein
MVGAEDHFKVLFNLGCRHYNERNLDAAYRAWTEALDLATTSRNREWMGLLTENLQGLSYEVLMAETNRHVDDGALDDAERTLALAERIATRARKATWLTEVARLRQRVLRGLFQRHHERAEERFEALQQYQMVRVTDDDRYEEDGVLVQHTALYVNEWAQMLLVKEAIEGWAEAYQRCNDVGGQQGRAMQEVVDTAVAAVTVKLLEKYLCFALEGPSTLTSYHTWGLTELERSKLVDLWRDIASKARVLKNARWELLQAAQLGNLLFASHELTAAMEQFRIMAERAEQTEDRYLLAAAKYHAGAVHLQRSNFADAEAQLRYGVELLVDLRREMPDPTREALSEQDQTLEPGRISLPGSADITSRLSPSAGGGVHSASILRPTSQASSTDPLHLGGAAAAAGAAVSWPTPLMAADLHYRLYHLLSRCLVCAFKFSDGLEMHERSLVAGHCDVLYEKLTKNFTRATRDHIACVAATVHAPLVYFVTHYRHEWNVDAETYDVLEHLYVWVVPAEGAAKFTLVDVEKDHHVKSILHVIDRSRKALSVQTNSEDTTLNPVGHVDATDLPQPAADATPRSPASPAPVKSDTGIRLDVPELQWREPLQELFRILMHRVVDTISAYAQYTNQNGFVVIPHGYLWLVPFSSLIDRDGRFLIESFTVTHGLSATQLASAALSWRSASDSGYERRLVVSQPEAQPSSIEPHLAFLTDTSRAEGEAAEVAASLDAEVITGTPTDAVKIPTMLPRCRLVHVSTPVLSDCTRNSMTGGIAATTSYDQLGILHATDIAFTRIRAELAVHTNVNVARDACVLGMHEGSLSWMRALLGCGVTCCVFPLWCTPDMMPVDFALAFYAELERCGGHKARAVAGAMRRLLANESSPSSNPRIWAPYVVLGFPVALEKKRQVPKKPSRPHDVSTSRTSRGEVESPDNTDAAVAETRRVLARSANATSPEGQRQSTWSLPPL